MLKQSNKAFVHPQEEFVLFSLAGPGPEGLLVKGDLSRAVARNDGGADDWVFSRPGDRVLSASVLGVSVHEVPGLKEIERVKPKATLGSQRLFLMPGEESWAHLIRDSRKVRVTRLEGVPLRAAESGECSFTDFRGSAMDAETGHLLLSLSGDSREGAPAESFLEVFEPLAMKSVAILGLPSREVSWGLVASGGWAWVGSRDGSIVPVDVLHRKVLAPVRVFPEGEVYLAITPDGRYLAAMASRCVEWYHCPTRVAVFRIEEGGLNPVAETRVDLVLPVTGLAILERVKTVVLTGIQTLAWRFDESESTGGAR